MLYGSVAIAVGAYVLAAAPAHAVLTQYEFEGLIAADDPTTDLDNIAVNALGANFGGQYTGFVKLDSNALDVSDANNTFQEVGPDGVSYELTIGSATFDTVADPLFDPVAVFARTSIDQNGVEIQDPSADLELVGLFAISPTRNVGGEVVELQMDGASEPFAGFGTPRLDRGGGMINLVDGGNILGALELLPFEFTMAVEMGDNGGGDPGNGGGDPGNGGGDPGNGGGDPGNGGGDPGNGGGDPGNGGGTPAPVPVPAALPLFASALGLFGLLARRRRTAASQDV